ncbi:glypican-5-like isoform X2 [Poecilia reticulata]|uniref:glypican-5-like isoform X2 n=1 Tax=Poecilia reticulata TaxID=8081 RepID=UPI0004A2678C|nr:PREDICTED: glypican-5-like isoform X2 [Poecilia reticulata]
MFRADIQNVHLFGVILLCFALFPEAGCGSADAGSCHEVKIAYMMRQIGPVELVPERPGTGEPLRVCVHAGPSCCTSKMEDSYMAAVRSEMQHKMRSYSFELKYLIDGHGKAFQETFESLVSFTSNLTCSLFDSAYSALASDCRLPVFQLFSDIRRHLSGDADSSLNNAVRRFYNDLFPLVYRRLLNPGIGRPSATSHLSFLSNHDDCLRMTQQDVSPFGPHPRLLVGSLSRALGPGRALSRLLRLAGEVVNSTEKVGVSELGAPWGRLVVLLQRLAATLATSSNHNSMELALLAVRNHVNDAILHAQLHGPRITATVEKVCGPQEPGFMLMDTKSSQMHPVTRATLLTSKTSAVTLPASPHRHLQSHPQKSFPLKGAKGDKSRSLKKLSREFEISIQRYQWFLSELPEMLCESEMEVEQHTCWSGEDVVESYAGHVVGSTLKAQKENPETSIRHTDPALKEVKQRLERLTQELLVDLGWASRKRGRGEEDGGSALPDGSGGGDCDDEDGCGASGEESSGDGSSSGRSPEAKDVAPAAPRRPVPPVPPVQNSPPQVAVHGSAHSMTFEPLTGLIIPLLLMLSPWERR